MTCNYCILWINVLCVIVLPIADGQKRVVGGSDATAGTAPYQVSLQNLAGFHVCGGALVSSSAIISAAHCFIGVQPSYVHAIVGTVNLNSSEGYKYNVSTIILHEKYDADIKENDISIVITTKDIVFNKVIKPIKFTNKYVDVDDSLKFTGFGSISSSGEQNANLQVITLNVLEHSTCRYAYRKIRSLFDSQLCTFNSIGEGTCHGDSGGPLVLDGFLVGIASFGIPCAVGYPDVFTRTANFLLWIKTHAPDVKCVGYNGSESNKKKFFTSAHLILGLLHVFMIK